MANENVGNVGTSVMPLQGEMQLAQYISSLFGGKVANPNYTGATVPKPQLVDQLGGQDIQNLMTEYMRGNGQFLQNMFQQNQAGLYNSSTRRLVANDINAQAALKASQANVPIQQGNASLMNQYYSRLANQQPQYLPGNPQAKQNAAMGLGIAALNKLLGGDTDSKGKKVAGTAKSGVQVGKTLLDQIADMFSSSPEFTPLPEGGFEATRIDPFAFDPAQGFQIPNDPVPIADMNYASQFEPSQFAPVSGFDQYNFATGQLEPMQFNPSIFDLGSIPSYQQVDMGGYENIDIGSAPQIDMGGYDQIGGDGGSYETWDTSQFDSYDYSSFDTSSYDSYDFFGDGSAESGGSSYDFSDWGW